MKKRFSIWAQIEVHDMELDDHHTLGMEDAVVYEVSQEVAAHVYALLTGNEHSTVQERIEDAINNEDYR